MRVTIYSTEHDAAKLELVRTSTTGEVSLTIRSSEAFREITVCADHLRQALVALGQ